MKEYRASSHVIERYKGKIKVIKKLLEAAEDIVNGMNESDACRKHGIDKESFRRYFTEDYKFEGDICFVESCDPEEFPTWQDALFAAIVGDRYKSSYSCEGFAERVEDAISTLAEKEQTTLRLRFEEGYTLDEVGEIIGVTRERVRQIEARALRRLRHPRNFRILCYGYEALATDNELTYDLEAKRQVLLDTIDGKKSELLKLQEQINAISNFAPDKKEYRKLFAEFCEANGIDPLDLRKPDKLLTTLEGVELSVRTWNALKRAGCNTLADVYEIALDNNLYRVRNLGRKSAAEILCKIIEYGGDEELLKEKYEETLAPYLY